jgi:Protein of unknown function (DUF732)
MMTGFKLSRLAICVALSTVMSTFPAFAHADSQDDQFLAAVHSQGISGDPVQLIAFAHSMCDVYGTPAAIGPQYGLMATQRLSPQQVAYVAIDGVKVYCPEKSGLIPPMLVPPS